MTHNPSQKLNFCTKVTIVQRSSFPIATISTAQQHFFFINKKKTTSAHIDASDV